MFIIASKREAFLLTSEEVRIAKVTESGRVNAASWLRWRPL